MTRILTAVLLALTLGGAMAHAQDTAQKSTVAATQVNLNTATVAQLDGLPGIGKAVAERIVDYRQKNGGFKKIEDLMNVKGVGEKSFLKLKPLITVGAARPERGTQE